MATTRRRPGTLPPALTPEQNAEARRCAPIALHLAVFYARRNRVGLNLDDLLGPAEEAVTLAMTTHRGSNIPVAIYVWARVRSTLKTLVRQTAERQGFASNDVVASRTAEAGGEALDAYAATLEDRGNLWRDTREQQLAHYDDLADDSATALVVGGGGHVWHTRGDLGMVMRIEHLRTNKALRDEVTRLPPEKATVIDLRFFQELSMKEVCARTGVSESTVSRIIAEALPILRARLEARGIKDLGCFDGK